MRKLTAALGLALTLVSSGPARACAPAAREGAYVGVATEDAIVAYDPTTAREDFIRRAAFETAEKDFGFLVPTPTKPELAEAPDQVFAALASVVAPKLEFENKYDAGFEPTMICPLFAVLARSKSAAPVEASAAARAVTVLEQKQVAGYDASVLAADDASALVDWLKDHGYATRKPLVDWLAPYVQKRWIVTAFKIAKAGEEATPRVSSTAVRMTFTTDKPFFPYREPADLRENLPAAARGSLRALRIFAIMPDRAQGALEESYVWPGAVKYARPADIAAIGALPFKLAPNAWLTEFEDTSSPRPGVADLFFTPSKDKGEVVPPPLKVTHHLPMPIPIDGVFLALLIFSYLGVRIRKRRVKDQLALERAVAEKRKRG